MTEYKSRASKLLNEMAEDVEYAFKFLGLPHDSTDCRNCGHRKVETGEKLCSGCLDSGLRMEEAFRKGSQLSIPTEQSLSGEDQTKSLQDTMTTEYKFELSREQKVAINDEIIHENWGGINRVISQIVEAERRSWEAWTGEAVIPRSLFEQAEASHANDIHNWQMLHNEQEERALYFKLRLDQVQAHLQEVVNDWANWVVEGSNEARPTEYHFSDGTTIKVPSSE